MKILFGTGNHGKLDDMRSILATIGIDVVGLKDLGQAIPHVEEDGQSPLDNARLKSKAYYEAYKLPVFSYDSGLYFIDEPQLKQPETYVRRYLGYEMDDEMMISHYSEIARQNGGTIKAQYINGIHLTYDDQTSFEYQGPDISGRPFHLVSQAHESVTEGFPLNSLSKDIDSGMYFKDMRTKDTEETSPWQRGIIKFFEAFLDHVKQESESVVARDEEGMYEDI